MFVDDLVRNALTYSLLPIAVTVAGGIVAAYWPPGPGFTSAVRRFAAGTVFSIIATEVLPDVLSAHPLAAVAAFSLGIGVMVGLDLLIRKLSQREGRSSKSLGGVIAWAAVGVLMIGLLIGSGFAAGAKDGPLLTFALTTEALALGLALSTATNKDVPTRKKAILLTGLLGLLIALGTGLGVSVAWGRTVQDIDPLLIFGLATLLLHGMRSLVKIHERQDSSWTIALFFAGFVLFLWLGRYYGSQHTVPLP